MPMPPTPVLTPREAFIHALEMRPPIPGTRVPTFELVFFLTMQAFGKVHPSQRAYAQWDQMEELERDLHRNELADLYIQTAEKYEHSAIFLHPNPGEEDEVFRLIDLVRQKSADRYFLMMHGDATYSLPDGSHMQEFVYKMTDNPQGLLDEANRHVDEALARAERMQKHGGLDGYALCSDYCFNEGPFLSPRFFRRFITPFLTRLTKTYRELGFYVIKHTDGNIMPILDQLIESGPHGLHSIDPMAGVDIAEVKRIAGRQLCLIGNVDCSKLDSGTDEEIAESVRYALSHGMPEGGYIFSTSNCVYTGMPLRNYEFMLDIWRQEGNYLNV